MKTLEEIKKFFPNHKFEDDFDLKLIQFTAEDLIDFSGGYAKKVVGNFDYDPIEVCSTPSVYTVKFN